MADIYGRARAHRMRRSTFNLSHTVKFDFDMGQLIPFVQAEEMMPGDTFEMGNQFLIRSMPLVSPVMHEVNVFTHYFFVPYRILCDNEHDFESFITGFNTEEQFYDPAKAAHQSTGESTVILPEWSPTNNAKYSLWDYFGLPVGVVPTGALPLDFARRAYNLIWNCYYRDENLQDPVDLSNENILNRAWSKDYFTSATPWALKGTSPSFPLSGTLSAVWDSNVDIYTDVVTASGNTASLVKGYKSSTGSDAVTPRSVLADTVSGAGYVNSLYATKSGLNNNTVDLSEGLVGFNIEDLQLAYAIERWMQKNTIGGTRYNEFLLAHFGLAPRDATLQRPEYIGGSKSPLVISEVTQTSQTTTGDNASPLGTLGGKAVSADRNYIAKYTAKEFGCVIGIMSVMPVADYTQGIPRKWLRKSRFDFPFPEFVKLPQEEILNAEVFASSTEADNVGIFGYQGRYNELRQLPNRVCGDLRDTLQHWTLARHFDSLPTLGSDFIECDPDETKDIYATESVPGLICEVHNLIKAYRPLPVYSEV